MDLAIKWMVAAALAAVVTRRVTPANAAAAHRVWFFVLLTPAWWAIGGWLFEPAVYMRFSRPAIAEVIVRAGDGWRTAIMVLYGAVTLMLLMRVAAGVWSVHRLTRAARPLGEADRARLARIIGGAAGRIYEGRLDVPVTAGFISPVILLPAAWRSLPPDNITAILHHEAAHVRRRDCTLALACAVIEAIFWFHPAAWLAARRVRWFAELACDAEATQAMHDRSYAAALLSLADGWNNASRPRYTVMAGAGTNVATRIHLLLDELDHGRARRPLLVLALVILASGFAVGGTLDLGGVSEMSAFNAHRHSHPHAGHLFGSQGN